MGIPNTQYHFAHYVEDSCSIGRIQQYQLSSGQRLPDSRTPTCHESYQTTDGEYRLVNSYRSPKCCGTSSKVSDMSLWPMASTPSSGCSGGITSHSKQEWIDYCGRVINVGNAHPGYNGLQLCIDSTVYYYAHRRTSRLLSDSKLI